MSINLAAPVNTGATYSSTKIELQRGNTEFSLKSYARTAKSLSAQGNAQVDTAITDPWGTNTGVLLLDGNGDWVQAVDSTDFHFSGDYTINFKIRFNSLPSAGTFVNIYGQYVDTSNYVRYGIRCAANGNFYCYVEHTSGGTRYVDNEDLIATAGNLSINTWYEFEIGRNGNNFYHFNNGVTAGAVVDTAAFYDIAAVFTIGQGKGTGSITYLNGQISDFYIKKGVCDHTANYTPRTSPMTNLTPNMVLLMHGIGADGSTTFTDDVTAFATDSPMVDPVFLGDSGNTATVWDMSAFDINENLASETGIVKYQYSCDNGVRSYNGSWLTLAQLQAESDPTGRYMAIKSQFISDGTQDASLADSLLIATLPSGGGGNNMRGGFING